MEEEYQEQNFSEFKGEFIDTEGNKREIKLKDVGYVPKREGILFSITKETYSNWILSGNRNKIKITYQEVSLEFK